MFWVGAIVSLCYVPGLTGAYIATQWPVLAALLPFWLLKKGPLTVVHLFGLLFVTYAALRVPFSPVPDISVFGLWLVVIMGLSMWFGTVLDDARGLYAGLALGASVSSALAVWQYFGVSFGIPALSVDPAGLYINSVQQGTILALIAVALVTERMWSWLLPLVPGFVLAHSRGALVLLCVGLLACYVRRLWILGLVAVVGAAYLGLPLSHSDSERMFIWHTAWDNLTWLGMGPGVFFSIVLTRPDGVLYFPEYAHNDALQLVFEYGIGAFFVFAVFAYALWRTESKEWPVIAAFVAAGCYSMPLFMPITAFLAFVAVGRVLRTDAVAIRFSDYGRSYVVPWKRVNS